MTHAHPLEFVLLVLSIGAALFTGYMLWGRLQDWSVACDKYKRGTDKRIISSERGLDEALRFSKCVLFVIASVIAVCLPPPPPEYSTVKQSYWFLLLMCGVVLLLWTNSLRSLLAQKRLERKAAERRNRRKVKTNGKPK